MKAIYSFLISLLFFLTLMGCRKLKEETYSVLSNYSNETEVNSAIIGVYQTFFVGYPTQMELLSMLESGHRYSTYGNYGDPLYNYPFYNHAVTTQEPGLTHTWTMLYRMINNANEVIETVPVIMSNQPISDTLQAEARFLRAWAYFTLTQLWGEVPLHLESTKSIVDPSVLYKERSPVADVYKAIEDDLLFCIDKLPPNRQRQDLGRVTRASAMGMLGKVYLTSAGKPLNKVENYQKAVNILDDFIQQSDAGIINAGLLPNYGDIFSTHNEMNREVLFAFRASATSTSQNNATIYPWFLGSHGCYPQSPGDFQPTQFGLRWDILRLFEPEGEDSRLMDGIGGKYPSLSDPFVNGVPDTVYYDTTLSAYRLTSNPGFRAGGGLGYTKWKSLDRFIGGPAGFQKDWIILRYADALLCLAEALNETDKPGLALNYINQVRNRSGASSCPNVMYPNTDKLSVRQLIRDERLRELVGEGTTIPDIRRWGTLEEEINAMVQQQFAAGRIKPNYDPKLELFPIPFSEISTNPKLLPQNPGW